MKINYQQALKYIFEYTDYEKQSGFSYDAERFDLGRVDRLLALMGNPHHRLRCVHIAGTKGKGSVSAMLASILQAAGYRVALYTSPHLHTFRERIQIDGQLISEADMVAGVEKLQPIAPQVPGITSFELITALAFDYFAQERVDLAVIEVGMGGRLDATNVIHPMVSVITSISYDHMIYLGNTLTEIAQEKAGIIKHATPVVCSAQVPEALRAIERVARERDAPLVVVGHDWQWESEATSPFGQRFAAWASDHPDDPSHYELPLLGRHQQMNATTVLATIAQLVAQGVAIPDRAIHDGLNAVYWPGRAEVLGQCPWVLVDGAHNADSMSKLSETIRELFSYNKMILIFGASADKDLDGMWDAILPIADTILTTQANHPRAADAQALSARLADRNAAALAVPIDAALSRALELASPDDLICATGSLFVVAEIRFAWLKHAGQPLPPTDADVPDKPAG